LFDEREGKALNVCDRHGASPRMTQVRGAKARWRGPIGSKKGGRLSGESTL